MLPKSELFRIGETFMFVVVNDQCYSVGNLGTENGSFFWFCGGKFPLQKSVTLTSLEKNYFEKSEADIERFKSAFARKQKKIDRKSMVAEIEKNDFLRFYLLNVQRFYLKYTKKCLGQKYEDISEEIGAKENEAITKSVLSGLEEGIAIINQRIYPLKRVPKLTDSCVVIGDTLYGLMESPFTIGEFEGVFQKRLEQRLRQEVLQEIFSFREQKKLFLDSKLAGLLNECKRHRYSYEYNQLGLDTKNNYIYFLPADGTKLGKLKIVNKAVGTPLTKRNGKVAFSSPICRHLLERGGVDGPFILKSPYNNGQITDFCMHEGKSSDQKQPPNSGNINDIIDYLGWAAISYHLR